MLGPVLGVLLTRTNSFHPLQVLANKNQCHQLHLTEEKTEEQRSMYLGRALAAFGAGCLALEQEFLIPIPQAASLGANALMCNLHT